MADSDILRDFLVRVRYTNDERTMRTAENQASAFGSTLTKIFAVASIVQFAKKIDEVNAKFNTLSLTAHRMGMSVAGVKSMSNAFEELGYSADAAKGQILALQIARSINPVGTGAQLALLGFKGDLNDNNITSDDIVRQIAKAGQKMPLDQFLQMGQGSPFSPDMLRTMRDPAFLTNWERNAKGLKKNELEQRGNESANLLKKEHDEENLKDVAVSVNARKTIEAETKIHEQLIKVLQKVVDTGDMVGKTFQALETIANKTGIDFGWLGDLLKPYANAARQAASAITFTPSGSSSDDMMNYSASVAKANGMSDNAVTGMLANMGKESNFNPLSQNPSYDFYGLMQWGKARRADFKKQFGYDMKDEKDPQKAAADQMKFAMWERNNTEAGAYNKFERESTDPYSAGYAFSKYIERPEEFVNGNPALGQAQHEEKRGEFARKLAGKWKVLAKKEEQGKAVDMWAKLQSTGSMLGSKAYDFAHLENGTNDMRLPQPMKTPLYDYLSKEIKGRISQIPDYASKTASNMWIKDYRENDNQIRAESMGMTSPSNPVTINVHGVQDPHTVANIIDQKYKNKCKDEARTAGGFCR